MDKIATFDSTIIPVILGPTIDAFTPLLEARRADIESIPSKTFKYGGTDRHQLDVYYPPSGAGSGSKMPVLFFVYGGGFTSGERKLEPTNLVYTNIGAFFAQRGIMTVIADYRLVGQGGKHPETVEDIRDAITWFLANQSIVAAAGGLPASTPLDALVVAGHSAGANIAASLYLSPEITPVGSALRAATKGLVLVGGALQFDLTGPPMLQPGLLAQYYGSNEAAMETMPTALVARAPAELIASLPPVFVLKSEHEPPPIHAACDKFAVDLGVRLGRAVRCEVMKGHNHVSFAWSFGSGEGEEHPELMAEFVKAQI
ncbi:alpha/beta-hydrolase [Epithele typhae]|uniref:alpha/beta-hydrolase n=1 Tax=Epithele typhae TaxID=378194 RepID=UPI002007E5F4|nr:alpha/beta-hydrolase [Epithele typhae]KAH9933966.1 alpha/beta-hydrolase [Epithele typhae]